MIDSEKIRLMELALEIADRAGKAHDIEEVLNIYRELFMETKIDNYDFS